MLGCVITAHTQTHQNPSSSSLSLPPTITLLLPRQRAMNSPTSAGKFCQALRGSNNTLYQEATLLEVPLPLLHIADQRRGCWEQRRPSVPTHQEEEMVEVRGQTNRPSGEPSRERVRGREPEVQGSSLFGQAERRCRDSDSKRLRREVQSGLHARSPLQLLCTLQLPGSPTTRYTRCCTALSLDKNKSLVEIWVGADMTREAYAGVQECLVSSHYIKHFLPRPSLHMRSVFTSPFLLAKNALSK